MQWAEALAEGPDDSLIDLRTLELDTVTTHPVSRSAIKAELIGDLLK